MKFSRGFGAFFSGILVVSCWGAGASAESQEKVTDYEPVSVSEASYIDLMDEINRLMEVKPKDIEDPEEAIAVFERFENMVRGLVKINDLETADKLAQHARNLYADQMRSAFLAGWVQGLMGNRQEAVDLLLQGLGEKSDVLPDPDSATQQEIKTTLAGFLIDLGDAQKAIDYLNELTDEEKGSALAYYLAGLAYHQVDDAYSCAKAYKEALRLDETLASANDFMVYAWAEDRLNRPRRSHSILTRAIEKFPMEPGLYFNRAANEELMGASREAFLDYQMEILVSGPEGAYSAESKKRIAKILSIQAKLPSPDKDLMNVAYYLKAKEQLSRIDPSKIEDEQSFKRQEERMNGFLKKAIEADRKGHPFLVYLQAERLKEQKEYSRMIELLEKALEDYPGQVIFQVLLAQAYAERNKTEESEKLIREAQLNAPDHWIVQEVLGPRTTSLSVGTEVSP